MGAAHSHDAGHHGHDHADDHAHGTFKSYVIGFILSVVLTVIPFWLVMARPLDSVFETTMPVALILMGFAMVQMVVHIIFFLHMHPKSQGGWSMMALCFTVTVVVIVMAGSMWVMYHLNTNMMPLHDMQKMDTTGESYIPSKTEPSPVP